MPTDRARSFRLRVDHRLAVGPPGNVFLFGGAGLAAAIEAARIVTKREPVWATAQYLSYARADEILDIEVDVPGDGRNISQTRIMGRVGDRTVLVAGIALGARDGELSHQWAKMPHMPRPEDCVAWPVWPEQGGGLNATLDLLLAPGSPGTRERDGSIAAESGLQLWIRTREEMPVDAAMLAIFADFVPAGVASALGRVGGGNSLDNTLRIASIVPTRWVLCDIDIAATTNGIAHGDIRLFAEDGTLMATGSQSLITRFLQR